MRYFRAYSTTTLPFLAFQKIADTDDQLQEFLDENNGGNPDPLVVTEDQLINDQNPNYISMEFGICHKVVGGGGTLIDRSQGQIDDQEAAFNRSAQVVKTDVFEDKLKTESFAYDGKEFPMTASARELYRLIPDQAPGDIILISLDGDYTLTDAGRNDFLGTYKERVFELKDASIAP